MRVWATETFYFAAGDSQSEARRVAATIAAAYPHLPWLLRGDDLFLIDDAREFTVLDPEPVTRTAREWARALGAGFLFTIDFTTGQAGPLRGPKWLGQIAAAEQRS